MIGLLREQMAVVGAGLVGGALLAWWAIGLLKLKLYLYQFTPGDLRIWSAATGVVAVTALAGVIIPAVLASRTDPMHVLRAD